MLKYHLKIIGNTLKKIGVKAKIGLIYLKLIKTPVLKK